MQPRLSRTLDGRLSALEKLVGHPFDPVENCHVAVVLYELGVTKTVRQQGSVSKLLLRHANHPVVASVIEYQSLCCPDAWEVY